VSPTTTRVPDGAGIRASISKAVFVILATVVAARAAIAAEPTRTMREIEGTPAALNMKSM
jgi:hypothetical protein